MDNPLPRRTPPVKIDSVFDTLLTDDDVLLNQHIEGSYTDLTSRRTPQLEQVPGWLLTIHRILAWIRLRLGAHDEQYADLYQKQQKHDAQHDHLTKVISDLQTKVEQFEAREREREQGNA